MRKPTSSLHSAWWRTVKTLLLKHPGAKGIAVVKGVLNTHSVTLAQSPAQQRKKLSAVKKMQLSVEFLSGHVAETGKDALTKGL